MSIQNGQPFNAATRTRTNCAKSRPMSHFPEPNIMFDTNDATMALGACAWTFIGLSRWPRASLPKL
jgi:hypothetical protein